MRKDARIISKSNDKHIVEIYIIETDEIVLKRVFAKYENAYAFAFDVSCKNGLIEY